MSPNGAAGHTEPLGANEVRVFTLDSGEREVTRTVRRAVFAALLGATPGDIAYDIGAKGKPALRNDPSLHFSVSHSHDTAMIAVTRVAPVGVDVDRIRPMDHAAAVLRRFFSEAEMLEILSADNPEFRYIRAWTRAEATVKVRGASVWEAATPDPSVTTRDLVAPEGYAATIAVAAPTWHLTQRTLRARDWVG